MRGRLIPEGGEDGDILIIRDGEPTWVSPREALGIRCVMKPGEQLTAENFTNGLHVESRQAPRPKPMPVSELPPPPPLMKHRPRTAWRRLLDDD